MAERSMQASEFKARCLAVLDEVARTREEVVVTKHGVPVARLVPIRQPPSTERSVTLLADDDESYFSIGESWNADR